MPPAFRPHLLVVDDEAPIREALATALGVDYVVHTVATGQEACAVLRAHPIAAIILDAVLGEEHGLDLVEQFRALSSAKILVLTGYGTEDLAIRALRVKVDDYLKKPPNLQELQAALTRMIVGVKIPPDPVVRLRSYLDEHLEDACPMDELAKQVGLSERHLRRRFQQSYGVTPRRYLAEARLRQAADFLHTTDLGLKQIALGIGFPSLAGFRHAFTRLIGMTPQACRALRKSAPPA